MIQSIATGQCGEITIWSVVRVFVSYEFIYSMSESSSCDRGSVIRVDSDISHIRDQHRSCASHLTTIVRDTYYTNDYTHRDIRMLIIHTSKRLNPTIRQLLIRTFLRFIYHSYDLSVNIQSWMRYWQEQLRVFITWTTPTVVSRSVR